MVNERDQASQHEESTVNVDRVLHVLTMEYQYLSAQVLARLSARYQFLGFLTAGAAILAAGIGHPFFSSETWVLASLSIAVFLFGLLCFWQLGRTMVMLAGRIAALEKRINELVPTGPGAPKLLSWELDQQQQERSLVMTLIGLHRSNKTLELSLHDADE